MEYIILGCVLLLLLLTTDMVIMILVLSQSHYTEFPYHMPEVAQVRVSPSPYSAHPHLPPEGNLSNQFIIYRCQRGLCGGLADREKGIVMAYIISQMLRRNFGIIMNKGGCNMMDFLIPNEIDWVVSKEIVRGLNTKNVRNLGQFRNNRTLEGVFSEDVVYYEGNINRINTLMEHKLFINVKWARNKTAWEIFQIAFSQLFRFSSRTWRRYEEFRIQTEGRRLLCAHFRMGRSINNPHDPRSPERSPNVTQVVEHLKRKITRNSVVFMATDSVETRANMMETFPNHYVELPGIILHIDRSGKSFDCSGMEKAILDQYILTKCHTLFISRSGFSELAAMLRGSLQELYQALPDSVVALTSLQDI